MTEEKPEASAVSVKIPPFWTDKPEMWFFQVEAQFKIANITSEETKFNYLVAQLEPRYIENIWDIIKGDKTNKYTAAKERLLATFTESESKKIKKLLTGLELGDMTPSQLLRQMRSLSGGSDVVSDKVLRTLWLDKMPSNIKSILIVSDESLEIEKLAIMADKIVEMSPRTPELSEVQRKPSQMDELITRISSLENQIASMSVHRCSRSPNRQSPIRNRTRSRSRRKFDPNGKLCFYHFHYGKKCYPEKCVQPCSWKHSENQSQQ